MSNQRKFCPNCGASNDVNSAHCTSCGAALQAQGYPSQPQSQYNQPYMPVVQPVESVNILWYAVAIVFGLLGALVAWYANRNKNPKAAQNLLIIGVVSWVIQYFLFMG